MNTLRVAHLHMGFSIQRICDKIKKSFFDHYEQKRTRLKLSILTQIDELKSYTKFKNKIKWNLFLREVK